MQEIANNPKLRAKFGDELAKKSKLVKKEANLIKLTLKL